VVRFSLDFEVLIQGGRCERVSRSMGWFGGEGREEESGCFWFSRGREWVDDVPVMMRVPTAMHQRCDRECDVTVAKTGCKGSGSGRHEVSRRGVDPDMVGERGQRPISDM
jgi:hypothetical protein